MSKRLIIDLDNTISHNVASDYATAIPDCEVIAKIAQYKSLGFEIVIYTSRNMRTFGGSIGKITKNTVPIILEWLRLNDVVYDELIVGKPWCGLEGFYVDDRSIRPAEFVKLSVSEINSLLEQR